MNWTVPPITSVIASPPSLYGMWTISPPRRDLSSSPARWPEVPLPADEKLTPPGLAAWACRSFRVLKGELAATTSKVGVDPAKAIGAKSFTASYGIFR